MFILYSRKAGRYMIRKETVLPLRKREEVSVVIETGFDRIEFLQAEYMPRCFIKSSKYPSNITFINSEKQNIKQVSGDFMECPYCGSKDIVYRGYRYNQRTKKRLRLCKSCGRKFTLRDDFWRMRFSKEDIVKAVSLYKQGFSLAEVKKHLEKYEGIRVSRWTILCWYKKYGKDKGKE